MVKSLLALHILFAMVWIGGMIYTLIFLRPSLNVLKTQEQKFELMGKVYGRFFAAVWLSIAVLFLTGMYLWHSYRKDFYQNPIFHFKLFLFFLMFLIFSYIYFFLYRKGKLSPIPGLVWVNTILGILIVLSIVYIR